MLKNSRKPYVGLPAFRYEQKVYLSRYTKIKFQKLGTTIFLLFLSPY